MAFKRVIIYTSFTAVLWGGNSRFKRTLALINFIVPLGYGNKN